MSAVPKFEMEAASTPSPALTLTPDHLAQRDAAKERRKKIDRAIVVSTISAWSLAVFAALSLPFALFGLKAAFIAAGLGVCAFFEFRGRSGLKQLDVEAPARLGWNQFALALVIAGYCVWSAYDAWFGPSPYAEAIATTPELENVLQPLDGLIRQVTTGAYVVVGVLTLFVQAATVSYYRSRRKFIEKYLSETPAWVLQLDRP